MAGTHIQIDAKFDDKKVQQAFQKAIKFAQSPEPLLTDIGEYLVQSTRDRFADQADPDSNPWTPLKPETVKRKKRNADKILVLDLFLESSFSYQINGDELLVGTNLLYAATHQFGDDNRGIAERRFLGISGDDEREILDIAIDNYRRAMDA